ncbi:MAG: hypothetical protein C0399_04435 [Syntrophus sp. (in: bacteria)]|nr:hypothetical protein [Syntrophus sp. (in: bacteria)]
MENHKKKYPIINRSNLRDILIVICIFSSVIYNLDNVRLIVSFFLLTFGCFFHYVTKGVLIRNIVLCKEGIYNVVRHPYYMANYFIDSSFCLLSGNIYLFLAYPFLFYWSYGPTIRQEESVLAGLYEKDFLKYSLDVPQLFPDAYSIRNMKEVIKGFSKQRITRNEISRFMRFWATGLFIVLIHNIKGEFLTELNNMLFIRDHYREIILLVLVIVLFVTSFFIQRKSELLPIQAEIE